MSTETIRFIRDGKPRTATSTFTQFLSSVLASSMSTLMGFVEFLTATPRPSPDAERPPSRPLDERGDQGGWTETETGGATVERDPSHGPQGNLRQGAGCCEGVCSDGQETVLLREFCDFSLQQE